MEVRAGPWGQTNTALPLTNPSNPTSPLPPSVTMASLLSPSETAEAQQCHRCSVFSLCRPQGFRVSSHTGCFIVT